MNPLPADRIVCRVTLRRSTGGATLYGIVSPKTGRKLEVCREHLADLPRVAGRIVHGIARGLQATFTVEELRAFHAAHVRQSTPRPLRYWGQRRRIGHRRAWR
ncbi:MAG TPA: hypothetical protein VHY37_08840 [Tepidisphaeraceae bacterium]|jgi:hypothetical protein|nr:hypothetical protein [Tepidisphaeraceae bacterium]